MRYSIGVLAVLLLILTGCVSMNDSYRNAVGERRVCHSVGVGVIGVPGAFVLQGMCDTRMKAQGFTRE